MFKLNAVSVIIGSIAAAALPTAVKHEASAPTVPPAPAATTAAPDVSADALPEFVSAVNFGTFVLASRESPAVSHDEGKRAAERLIEKISGATLHSDREFLHGVVENHQQLPDAAGDTAQAASREQSAPSTLLAPSFGGDPSRNVVAALDAEPSSDNGDVADVADPTKPSVIVETAVTLTRKRGEAEPSDVPVHTKLSRKSHESGSVVRLKRRQVASKDMPPPMGLLHAGSSSQASGPSEPQDTRALGGSTQSMAPMLSSCGEMTLACKANIAWCGCP